MHDYTSGDATLPTSPKTALNARYIPFLHNCIETSKRSRWRWPNI